MEGKIREVSFHVPSMDSSMITVLRLLSKPVSRKCTEEIHCMSAFLFLSASEMQTFFLTQDLYPDVNK